MLRESRSLFVSPTVSRDTRATFAPDLNDKKEERKGKEEKKRSTETKSAAETARPPEIPARQSVTVIS